jgi:hypothetical protein
MTSLGKWAPLKLTAIVALPHDGPLSQGRIIPQIASNKNCDKTIYSPVDARNDP